MSDTELITIGRYVTERMPAFVETIRQQQRPLPYQLLKSVSEILNITPEDIKSDSKHHTVVECRVIIAVLVIIIHHPQKLDKNCPRSWVVNEVAKLLNKTTGMVYKAIDNHNEWVMYHAAYREKFNYIKSAIIK